jgi:hypothetical protein
MDLVILKGKLDKASAAWLGQMMTENPNLDYWTFWNELRARFQKDIQTTHKQNWKSVKLQYAGLFPELQDWNHFQAQYKTKRAQVNGWNREDDRQQVLAQLPGTWLNDLAKAENRGKPEPTEKG